ncbi:hypothetical protein B296_00052734, partial [Ensete ventricosum]
MFLARFVISTCTARYERYIPVRQVVGTRTARYQAVPPKIDRRRSISVVGDRLREKPTVDGRLREKKWKKKNRKRRKKEKRSTYFLVGAPSLPEGRQCPRGIATRGSQHGRWRFFSRARRRNVSPCREKGRGD